MLDLLSLPKFRLKVDSQLQEQLPARLVADIYMDERHAWTIYLKRSDSSMRFGERRVNRQAHAKATRCSGASGSKAILEQEYQSGIPQTQASMTSRAGMKKRSQSNDTQNKKTVWSCGAKRVKAGHCEPARHYHALTPAPNFNNTLINSLLTE